MIHVKAFIETHLQDLHGPKDVAHGLNISYETLRKAFRREEKTTLGRYILLRRIERMKRLLARTDLYHYEICEAVGFSNEAHGARVFKRETGMTMSAYRAQQRGH